MVSLQVLSLSGCILYVVFELSLMDVVFIKTDASSCSHCMFQSNTLPGHVKINVTRENLFEDSFQQVCVI